MKQIYACSFMVFISVTLFQIPTEAQKKLSIIGSSTAACFNITGDSCYIGRLQKFYSGTAQFNNLAVAGSSVYRGMPSSYTPPPERSTETPDTSYNITAALKSHPDVVLVNYPSNGYDIFSVTEIMLCLRTINQTAINGGARCFITTTQPRSEPASYSTGETRRKMAEVKDSVLKEFGAFAINFWDEIVNPADSTIITELSQGDGTHLNSRGHAILFQKVKDKNIFGAEAPLPVNFIDFSASANSGESILQWTTAMEKNIQFFEIRRSNDGVHFKTIETVKPNNSILESSYLFKDKAPLPSMNYYQIVAVDINNHPEYSEVIKVFSNPESFTIQKVFFKNSLLFAKVESGDKQTIIIQVSNSSGQVLTKQNTLVNSGVSTIPVNVLLPNKGIYFLRLSNNRIGTQVKSFMRE